MKPRNDRSSTDYEKVKVDEWINGKISEIERDEKHEYKGQYGGIFDSVRIKFELEGCKYAKYSRWMKFSYSEKSNLYSKYLTKLLSDPKPFMDFDIQQLEGMKVKTMWETEKNPKGETFQVLQLIKPIDGLLMVKNLEQVIEDHGPEFNPEEHSVDTPF